MANLFVAQIQDYLGLGAEARINIPGKAEGNWRWRLESGKLTDELAQEIRELTWTYGRCASKTVPVKEPDEEEEAENELEVSEEKSKDKSESVK